MPFNVSACSRSIRASSRSISRVPPLKLRFADRALPSGDFGPVDFSHDFQRRSGSHWPSAHVLQQSAIKSHSTAKSVGPVQTDNGQSESETVDQYYANEMSRGFDGKCRLTDVQRPVRLPPSQNTMKPLFRKSRSPELRRYVSCHWNYLGLAPSIPHWAALR